MKTLLSVVFAASMFTATAAEASCSGARQWQPIRAGVARHQERRDDRRHRREHRKAERKAAQGHHPAEAKEDCATCYKPEGEAEVSRLSAPE